VVLLQTENFGLNFGASNAEMARVDTHVGEPREQVLAIIFVAREYVGVHGFASALNLSCVCTCVYVSTSVRVRVFLFIYVFCMHACMNG
jgi:hypothetical protein